eukprot:g1187.t1
MELRTASYALAYAADATNPTQTCVQRTYAHRSLKHVITTEFNCTNKANDSMRVSFRQRILGYSGLDITRTTIPKKKVGIPGVECSLGKADGSETPQLDPAAVAECHAAAGQTLLLNTSEFVVPPGETYHLALVSTRYSSMDETLVADDDELVQRAISGWKDANAAAANGTLWETHVQAMEDLGTAGMIEVDDINLAKIINASLSALMAANRAGNVYSSSPGGLLGRRYQGHTFWDVETWQLPTWQLFFPVSMARGALQYRTERMKPAAEHAHSVQNRYGVNESFDGLQFPWESAVAGVEQCPGNFEDHLQGDISWAFYQHWLLTRDATWLQQSGFPVIEGIARFWASRLVQGTDGLYH